MIWAGSGRAPGGQPAPDAGRARLRGALRALLVAVAGVPVFLWMSPKVAGVVWGVSSVILVTALFSPTGLHAVLERAMAALGRATGKGLNWVILVPLFYLVFLPFGLLLRRGRRDRMKRRFEPGASTYWEPHARPSSSSPWERQF